MECILAILIVLSLQGEPTKVREMRVTGYHVTAKSRGALGEHVRPGQHAAVSPACIDLLGEKVYIRGHGVFRVNDLAADWLDEKYGICTIDIAKGTRQEAEAVGNEISTVVRIPPKERWNDQASDRTRPS